MEQIYNVFLSLGQDIFVNILILNSEKTELASMLMAVLSTGWVLVMYA